MDKDLKDLNLRLDQFYKDTFNQNQEILRYQKENEAKHNEIHTTMLNKIDDLSTQLEPVTELVNNATGFKKVSFSIIKGVIAIGAGVGVIYGFIIWLRN